MGVAAAEAPRGHRGGVHAARRSGAGVERRGASVRFRLTALAHAAQTCARGEARGAAAAAGPLSAFASVLLRLRRSQGVVAERAPCPCGGGGLARFLDWTSALLQAIGEVGDYLAFKRRVDARTGAGGLQLPPFLATFIQQLSDRHPRRVIVVDHATASWPGGVCSLALRIGVWPGRAGAPQQSDVDFLLSRWARRLPSPRFDPLALWQQVRREGAALDAQSLCSY